MSVQSIAKANEEVDTETMYQTKQYQFKPRPNIRPLIDISTIE